MFIVVNDKISKKLKYVSRGFRIHYRKRRRRRLYRATWKDQTHWLYEGENSKQKDAVLKYYDRHNPHMRSLNAHNNYRSDWDPDTKLLYIVRDDYLINATVDCFSIHDNTEINSQYKWLK